MTALNKEKPSLIILTMKDSQIWGVLAALGRNLCKCVHGSLRMAVCIFGKNRCIYG